LKAIFQNCDYYAATTDGWSSNTLQHYWSLTLHGLTSDWKLVEAVLACEPIYRHQSVDGVYSASAVAKVLKGVMHDCELDIERLVAVVTDEGGAAPAIPSNIRPNLVSQPCGAHRLQTVLKNGFKKSIPNNPLVGAVITSAKTLVRLLKKSSTAKEKLASIQLEKGESITKLVQQIDVRWNSHLLCLQSLATCLRSITEFVTSYKPAPPSVKFLAVKFHQDIIQHLISLLEPFARVTQLWSSTNIVTINRVVPGILWIKDSLNNLKQKLPSPIRPVLSPVIDGLLSAIEEHFLPFKREELLAYALDPVNLAFLDDASSEDYSHLKKGLDLLQDEYNELKNDMKLESASSRPAQSSNVDDIERRPRQTTAGLDEFEMYSRLRVSFDNYNSEGLKQCPRLHFWSEHQFTFPLISRIVRRTLCIPAAQASSERVFSQMKHICTSDRSALEPQKAQKLLRRPKSSL
jgi:hypothetical protein